MQNQLPHLNHVILDLGAVLFDIRSEEDWLEEFILPLMGEDLDLPAFFKFHADVEHGWLSPDELYAEVHSLASRQFSKDQFTAAWNERLLDMPIENMELVLQLSERYNLFLLSNTNEIHYQSWWNTITIKFGHNKFKDAFDEIFLSHELGLMKPDLQIYEKVHEKMGLPERSACLFLDDNSDNVHAAFQFGWNSYVVEKNLASAIEDLKLLAGKNSC